MESAVSLDKSGDNALLNPAQRLDSIDWADGWRRATGLQNKIKITAKEP
jgi:hypothetical protein